MNTSGHEYPHGAMDRVLSAADGRKLPPDFALPHPSDYIEALTAIVPTAIADASVNASDVFGIGVDFASSTVIAAKI
ncbi:hypothetical protein O6R08_11080 [Cutibacterium equinum]|uniref:Uncharacterized protein n=1 Tax=Cutibacterium equinum TaxID=3016342 RepID=A0ABY7QZL7_9ACTN|nr:hypothetical protein [Cutibacterium equinum]WCC79962.1 hypothetical protein O6R08_11080 [Cutibacterium equinum]